MKYSTDIINRKLKIFQLRYKVLKILADILNRKKKEVIFIDFSNDGYNRRKQKETCILTNKDKAEERYAEIIDIIKNNKEPNYYKYNIIRDKINMDCISLNYSGHRVLDTIPTEEDFKKTVSQYLSWKISAMMSNTYNVNKDV